MEGDIGQGLICAKNGAFIWWPTVEDESLSQDQKLALHCFLPMHYDEDGDSASFNLLEMGYTEITPDNFDEAYKDLRRRYEKQLWSDNVGKQLLGRLLDGDLEGDGY